MCVCVRVRVRVRACVCACVCACVRACVLSADSSAVSDDSTSVPFCSSRQQHIHKSTITHTCTHDEHLSPHACTCSRLSGRYIYTIICLKSVCGRSQTAGRISCSIASGDVSNWSYPPEVHAVTSSRLSSAYNFFYTRKKTPNQTRRKLFISSRWIRSAAS